MRLSLTCSCWWLVHGCCSVVFDRRYLKRLSAQLGSTLFTIITYLLSVRDAGTVSSIDAAGGEPTCILSADQRQLVRETLIANNATCESIGELDMFRIRGEAVGGH